MAKPKSSGKAAALAAKAAKQTAKAAKGAAKSAKRSGAVDSDEEDIASLLAEIASKDAQRTAVSVDACAAPSPRVNCSLTPLPSGELLLFGGEHFDGSTNTCYNDLYRVTPGGGAAAAPSSSAASPSGDVLPADAWSWRSVQSRTTPPPRCSHLAVLLESKREVVVFGGEFATASQFHHHGDTWRFDCATNKWARDEGRASPSPRSGARGGAWRTGLLLHGGFHQTLTSDRWFGDLHFFDARPGGHGWRELALAPRALAPAPRSGHGFVLLPGRDAALLYGGYSEVPTGAAARDSVLAHAVAGKGGKGGGGGGALLAARTRSVVHTDLWLLRLAPLVPYVTGALKATVSGAGAPAGRSGGAALFPPEAAPAWERVRVAGVSPSPRAGFSLVPFRDRVVLFGGVTDADADEKRERIVSVFHNDLFSFDIARRRWFPLPLRARKAPGGSVRRRGGGAHTGLAAGGSDALDGDEEGEEGGGDDERDEEEEDALAAAAAARAGRHGGGKASVSEVVGDEFDDDAYYVLVNGRLEKLEPETEEELAAALGAECVVGNAVAGCVEGAPAAKDSSLQQRALFAGDTQPGAPAACASAGGDTHLATTVLVSPEPTPSVVSSGATAATSPAAAAALSLVPAAAPPAASVLPAPLGRLRACTWVDGHWLHIFGGLREEPAPKRRQPMQKASGDGAAGGAVDGDVEVTLDDAWRVDLRERLGGWEELRSGSWRSQTWRGDAESSDGSGSDGSSGSDDGSDDGSDGIADEDGASVDGEGRAGGGGGREVGGRHGRSHAASSFEAVRARELTQQLGLEDPSVTPTPLEDLRGFYARTASAWVQALLRESSGKGGLLTVGVGGSVSESDDSSDGDAGGSGGSDSNTERGKPLVQSAPVGGKPHNSGGKSSSGGAPQRRGSGKDKHGVPGLAASSDASRRGTRLREGERIAGKEVRRRAFALARSRYDEVYPIIAELNELEEAQRAHEAEAARRAQEVADARRGKAGKKRG